MLRIFLILGHASTFFFNNYYSCFDFYRIMPILVHEPILKWFISHSQALFYGSANLCPNTCTASNPHLTHLSNFKIKSNAKGIETPVQFNQHLTLSSKERRRKMTLFKELGGIYLTLIIYGSHPRNGVGKQALLQDTNC